MNDPQYQTGSSWALGGALRALGGALESRYRRQQSAKNVPKIPQKRRFRRALYQNSLVPSPLGGALYWASERVGVSAHACEREADTTAQRAESPVEVQEQRERERKRIGMGQVCTCAVQPRARLYTSHTQRAHARHSRALPVPHQKLGPGGGKGLLVATGHGRRRRRSRSKQRSPLLADL